MANEERCRRYLEDSLGLVTVLAPSIGYNAAAEVAKESVATGRSIREIVLARGLMPAAELDEGHAAGTSDRTRACRWAEK